jgi:hypothetical protein
MKRNLFARVEWTDSHSSSGFLHSFSLVRQATCCAAQRKAMSSMLKSLPDAVFLRQARLGASF